MITIYSKCCARWKMRPSEWIAEKWQRKSSTEVISDDLVCTIEHHTKYHRIEVSENHRYYQWVCQECLCI
jgi:hypothetical protein